jgi:Mitochondrial ribosomal death-associated protein 3
MGIGRRSDDPADSCPFNNNSNSRAGVVAVEQDDDDDTNNKDQNKKILPHARVLVTGRQGTGKAAALAAIVATARTSGSMVLYLPEGDNMSQNGYYIVPNIRWWR